MYIYIYIYIHIYICIYTLSISFSIPPTSPPRLPLPGSKHSPPRRIAHPKSSCAAAFTGIALLYCHAGTCMYVCLCVCMCETLLLIFVSFVMYRKAK